MSNTAECNYRNSAQHAVLIKRSLDGFCTHSPPFLGLTKNGETAAKGGIDAKALALLVLHCLPQQACFQAKNSSRAEDVFHYRPPVFRVTGKKASCVTVNPRVQGCHDGVHLSMLRSEKRECASYINMGKFKRTIGAQDHRSSWPWRSEREFPDRSFACNFTRAKFLHAKRGIIFSYYKNACKKITLSRVNFVV